MFAIISLTSQWMKLSALRIIASYLIPERISEKEFRSAILRAHESPNEAHKSGRRGYSQPDYNRESEKQKFIALCENIVDIGIQGRVQRIAAVRDAMMNQMNLFQDEFPKELVVVIVGFAFGMHS